jgi:hypothetical protein
MGSLLSSLLLASQELFYMELLMRFLQITYFFENEETYICKNKEYVCRVVSNFFFWNFCLQNRSLTFTGTFPPEVLMGYLTTGKT